MRKQILNYRKRCDWMRWATTIGFGGALLLLVMLPCGLANVVFGEPPWVNWLAAACGTLGLIGVMAAAVLALAENVSLREVMDGELSQVPDLLRRHRANGQHRLTAAR